MAPSTRDPERTKRDPVVMKNLNGGPVLSVEALQPGKKNYAIFSQICKRGICAEHRVFVVLSSA